VGNKDKQKKSRDGEITRLRKAIRRLESDKRKLLSEVNTLTAAFDKNIQFLKGETDDLTISELVDAAKKEMSLKEAKDYKNQTFSEMEDKWKCYKCQTGILKIVLFTMGDNTKYFRMCSNDKCKKRTLPKDWNDSVKGIRLDLSGKKK
jgi:predicted nuclease with TOPRIM domain